MVPGRTSIPMVIFGYDSNHIILKGLKEEKPSKRKGKGGTIR